MKLLLVASDNMEFRGLKLREPDIRVTANGAGAHRAAAAVDAAIASYRPDAIVSMGFCGALDPALAIADIVIGTEVRANGRNFAAQVPETAKPHHTGAVCSIDHVAGTSAEKGRLY